MSMNGITNTYIPNTLSGLESVNATNITINGVDISTIYVPFTGSLNPVDLGGQRIQTSYVPTADNDLTNKIFTDGRYVRYSGSTGDVNIGSFTLTANNSTITNTLSAGSVTVSNSGQLIASTMRGCFWNLVTSNGGANTGYILMDTASGSPVTTFLIKDSTATYLSFFKDGGGGIRLIQFTQPVQMSSTTLKLNLSAGTPSTTSSYLALDSTGNTILSGVTSTSISTTATATNADYYPCLFSTNTSGSKTAFVDSNGYLLYNPSVGDLTLSNGSLNFNIFSNINSGGFINKVGAINFNTGRYNGQLFIGDGTNNYLSFVNSYYGGGTPYVLFNQVASIAKNIQMSNSLGENFLYTNDSTTYPFSISAGVYRAISIISTGSTPIMKFMSIGANPLVSMTNLRASFNSLNGSPLEIYQPSSGAGYNNHIRFSMSSGVLHLIGQDDNTGNSLFTNPSGIANALCIGSNYNYPTIIYNQGTPIFRFANFTTTNYFDTTNSATISLGTFTTATALRTAYLNITGSGDLKMFGNTLETNSGDLILSVPGTKVYLNSAGGTYITFTKVGTAVTQSAPAGGFVWDMTSGSSFMALTSTGGLYIYGAYGVSTAVLNAQSGSHLLYKVDSYTYSHRFYYGAQHNLSINGISSTSTEFNQPNSGTISFASGGSNKFTIAPTITSNTNKFLTQYGDYIIHQINRSGAVGVNYGVATDYQLGGTSYTRTGGYINATSGNQGGWFADCLQGGVFPSDTTLTNALMYATWTQMTLNTPLSCNTHSSLNSTKAVQFGNTNYTNFANTNTVYGDTIKSSGNWTSGNFQVFTNTTSSNGGTGGLGVWGSTGQAGIVSLQPGVSWQNLYIIGGSVLAYHTSVLGSTLTSTGWVNSSDRRFKTNIRPVKTTRSLERVLAVKPYTYNMIYDEGQCPVPDKLKNQPCLGFIAQEIAESNPHCIHETEDKGELRYGLQYNDYVVHLCGAIQEHEKRFEQQKQKIEEQSITINSLSASLSLLAEHVKTLTNAFNELKKSSV